MKYIPLFFALLILTSCTGKEAAKQLITVSPPSAVVKMDTTAQFTVSPAGTAVTWSIKGDSEELLGVIDSSGSYKAPSDPATAPEKVVITATDSSGTTGTATAFLTTFNSNKRLTENYAEGQFKADTYSSGQKSIAVFKDSGDNVNIYTVWADDSLGNSHIWFSKSSNNGVTFNQLVPVDESSSENQISPSIAADSNNGKAYVVWEDYREGDADIFLSVYDGSSFGSVKKINQDIFGSVDYDSSPSIAINKSGDVYIVWEQRSDSNDNYPNIIFTKTTDHGETFSAPAEITIYGRHPSIAVDSDGIAYIVYENLFGFPSLLPTHIILSKITTNGSMSTKQVDSFAESELHTRYPCVAVRPDGQKVYVSWQRAEIKSPAFEKETTISYDIDLAVLDVASESISRVLSIPDSNNTGYFGGPAYPAITSDNNYIYIVWDDQRNGTKDIYFTKSSDAGNFTTNRIVNDDLGTWHEKPSVAVLDGKGYVIWTDYRNTSGDVFLARE